MRKSTFLWLTLAAVASATLFHTSQEVTDGRARLAQINKDIQQEEESLRVLQAEWSYLNQPERLEKLVRQFMTGLEPQKGRQFMQLSELKDRMIEPAAPTDTTKPMVEAPSIAADEAPHADADTASLSSDDTSAGAEEAPPATLEEVSTDAEAVAVNAAQEAVAKPEATFATEYRSAGPRKIEENAETVPDNVEDQQEAAGDPEASVTTVAPEPVAKVVAKTSIKETAPKTVAKPEVVKTVKPAAPKAVPAKPAPAKVTTEKTPQSKRGFNDVIKGLGVQKQ